jgi:hypothetical protein
VEIAGTNPSQKWPTKTTKAAMPRSASKAMNLPGAVLTSGKELSCPEQCGMEHHSEPGAPLKPTSITVV